MPGPMEGVRVVEVGMWVAGPGRRRHPRRLGSRRRQDRAARRRPVPRRCCRRWRRARSTRRSSSTTATSAASALNLADRGGPRGRRRARRSRRRLRHQRPPRRARPGRARPRDGVGPQPPTRLRARHRLRPRGRRERDRAAYDVGAFWSRAGVAASLTPGRLSRCRTSAAAWATTWPASPPPGAVSAALFARERTGEGQLVSVSLLRIGLYMVGWDVNMALRHGRAHDPDLGGRSRPTR